MSAPHPADWNLTKGKMRLGADTLTAIRGDVVRLLEELLDPATKFVAKYFPQPQRRKP